MPTTETGIEFNLTGLGSTIEANQFGVPIYQRSYAWATEQIDDFWSDLLGALDSKEPDYFIGSLVLTRPGDGERLIVIDGQQRLATTTVLLAAIRDVAEARGKQALAENITSKFLSAYDFDDEGVVPRLVLNAADDYFFRRHVLRIADDGTTTPRDQVPAVDKEAPESHQRLASAYATLHDKLKTNVENHGAKADERLNAWLKFLRENLLAITVVVRTEADAFLIFETLNARGAELTIGDLLKNYLFGRAGESLETVKAAWLASLAALDVSAENELFITFLRHYWSSRYGSVRERDLYRSIKERVTNPTQAVDFASELQDAARLYAALLNSGDDFWSDLGTTAKGNIESLLRLELEQNRPRLLAVMQHFPTQELKKLLKAMVAWSVRGLIVGGIGGGTTEKAYSEATLKVRAGSIKTAAELLVELTAIIPADEDFKSSFERARITKNRIARYLLIALEREKKGQKEPELVPNADESEVNLEHILPRNPTTSDWPQFNENEIDTWAYRIGNLALLAVGPNGKIGNKPWAVKKPVLEASELELTKQAGVYADWNQESIAKRQEGLAELAVKTWPRTAG